MMDGIVATATKHFFLTGQGHHKAMYGNRTALVGAALALEPKPQALIILFHEAQAVLISLKTSHSPVANAI